MTQLTNAGLIKVLGQVTLIMSAILVGAIIGIVADRLLATSPLFVLIGLAVGTAVAAIGVWLYIRARVRAGFGPSQRTEERSDES